MSISIIIPTIENRNNIILRTIKYYENSNFEIIVADSSVVKNSKLINKKIKYLHLPENSFFEKIEIAAKEASNKYLVLCQDDDFIISESLHEGKNFLEKNPDYSAVHGNYIFFEKIFNKIFYELGYGDDSRKSFDANEFEINYRKLIIAGPQLVSALTKKDIFLQNFSFLKNYNYIPLFELTILIFLIMSGKIKYLNLTWQLRDRHVYDKNAYKFNSKLGKINNFQIFLETNDGKLFLDELFDTIKEKKNINFQNFIEPLNIYSNNKIISVENQYSVKLKIKRLFPFIFKILKKINSIKRYISLFFKSEKKNNNLNLKKDLIEIEKIIYKHN